MTVSLGEVVYGDRGLFTSLRDSTLIGLEVQAVQRAKAQQAPSRSFLDMKPVSSDGLTDMSYLVEEIRTYV